MDLYDLDSRRLLARERQEQRLREADADRLVREIGGTAPHRRRMRFAVKFALGASYHLRPRRLET